MLIDVARLESWEELNDQVKSLLRLEGRRGARCYQGIGQAVFEIAQSTAQFMSHKKAIGFIRGQTPVFESLLPYFYKETYEVQAISHLQLTNVKDWVEGLKKDTNFVVYAEDHPVTGEIYPFVDELDQLLNAKRISSFRISHAAHFSNSCEVRPYSVRLCSYSPSAAIAILGERFRSPSLMVQNMYWQPETFLQEVSLSRTGHETNPLLVEHFEKDVNPISESYFGSQSHRLFDRAVCVFKDVSAEALAHLIAQKSGLSPAECWQKMATTNLCHWSVNRMFGHWWEPSPLPVTLRGLLIFGVDILNTKDFAKLVISSYEELKAQQSWEV